ncbi:hypothetical protein V6N13_062792 [Hibiscus sabdariffa]|uniref:Uncharacterized protein n=2 Tax=Hibiscus sabdariffa TaxID=183260 RepID=A0ABR1ZXB1_9ROSI
MDEYKDACRDKAQGRSRSAKRELENRTLGEEGEVKHLLLWKLISMAVKKAKKERNGHPRRSTNNKRRCQLVSARRSLTGRLKNS